MRAGRFSLHRAAEAEFLAGVDRIPFDDREAAKRLIEAIDEGLALLVRFPALGGQIDNRHRGFVLARVPYTIVYRPTAHGIRVIAIAHVSREPGYWRERR